MEIRAKLVPELLVIDLAASLRFWCELLGFMIAYDRPEEGFAYLDLNGVPDAGRLQNRGVVPAAPAVTPWVPRESGCPW